VTDNLISGQTMTFVSLTIGAKTFESKVKPVKPRQQSIEFEEEFACEISDDWLTIRTPPEDGSPTSTALPVIIKLHRKGLIDSEVIATGRILLPLESTEIDNISVGLFQVDEDQAEIAIAKLSVRIKLGEKDKGGFIGAVVHELEHMMIEYSRGRVGSQDNVSESLQKFLTAVTPLRRFIELSVDLLTWHRSYVSSWLFLLTITLIPPFGLLIAYLVIFCLSFQLPLPLLGFIPSSSISRPKGGPETPELSVELNVLFLSHSMSRMVYLSNSLSVMGNSMYVLLILGILYIFPLNWILIVIMAYNTFMTQAILRVISAKLGYALTSRPYDAVASEDGEMIVIENQRWWFGKWSDKLIGDEANPWADAEGRPVGHKDNLQPPAGMDWSSKWFNRNTSDPEDAWVYGRDFKSGPHNNSREIADFVRTRTWIRSYRPKSI
jgi:hypothetical protein